jgi:cytosine/uracil/thiamine/allantoin permease
MPGFLSAVSPGITVSTGATRLYYMCFLVGSLISALVFAGLHYVVSCSPMVKLVSEYGRYFENCPSICIGMTKKLLS